MLTEKDYCDYDTYVALEELGYPEVMAFNKPFLLYEAQKFLREEKKIEVNATSDFFSKHHWFWQIKSLINANNDVSYPYYRSYEEALLEGIKEAVKILKGE